jgi:hypothetical protein
MILTNRERAFLFSLKKKYFRENFQSLNFVDKVILAIEVIEKRHRNILWRFFEYIYLGLSFIFYNSYNNQIINLSIGIYQLKISYILDFLNIEYLLNKKKIIIYDYKLSILLLIIRNRNEKKILYNLIRKNEFCFFDNELIDYKKLEYFIQEYSKNLPFREDFNYFFVLKELINSGNYFDNN